MTVSHPEHGEVKIKVDQPLKLTIREIDAERELHYVGAERERRSHHFLEI